MNYEWLNQLHNYYLYLKEMWPDLYNRLTNIIPIIDGIGMSFIAYYTFRLTVFPKKLKFIKFKRNYNSFGGDSIEITLENRAICPIVIESIDLIINSHKIQFFEGEYIVDGFKTAKILLEPYSKILSENNSFESSSHSSEKISLWVKTSRGVQHVRYKTSFRFSYWLANKKESKYKPTTVYRNRYNGKIVVPKVKYAIVFKDAEEKIQTVFITETGAMSDALFGYNGLSKDIMKDEDSLRSHFNKEFGKHGMDYYLNVFNDNFINNNSEDKIE